MIWKRLTVDGKRNYRGEWKRWFAWYPIICSDSGSDYEYIVWLECVNRIKWYDDRWCPYEAGKWKWNYRRK